MAFMMGPLEDRIIGIKLEISPGITPRDTSIGTKIFMLVPTEARNVRDVKSYIANFVLKTHSPFHLLMGEYRIRDEEDARIFSIINEPCKLEPVPVPRSALSMSSTPKPRSSDKRVTFFDGDLSASPVNVPRVNGLDVVDHTQAGRSIHSPQEMLVEAALPSVKEEIGMKNDQLDLDLTDDLSDSSAERKRRRRRRHRNKKSRRENNEEDNVLALNGSQTKTNDSAGDLEGGLPHTSTPKIKLEVLNEETESEDETLTQDSSHSKCSEFITPVTKLSRKRSEVFIVPQQRSKKKKLSDSAFESSSNLSPFTPTEEGDCRSGSAVRVDTPIVSRSLPRNLDRLKPARKAIADVFDDKTDESVNRSNDEVAKEIKSATLKTEYCYENLKAIQCVEELNVGDEIAFKVLELDERYNPSISSYKEGVVAEKEGTKLSITFTKNNSVVRTGKYDFVEDLSEKDEEPVVMIDIQFSELLEPKLMSQIAMQPCASASQLVSGNDDQSPSNII